MAELNTYKYFYEYEGVFSYKYLLDINEKFENELASLVDHKIFRLFFFCVNEMIQNVGFYSDDKRLIEDSKESGYGSIKVILTEENLEIITLNPVSEEQKNKIAEKINKLNSLNADELKELHKEKLRSDQETDSKGGGIGFIEIIRKTKNPITISFEKINGLLNLNMKVVINLGVQNG